MQRDRKLGELLVERGLVDKAQLDLALFKQNSEANRIGSILVAMGALDEEDLLVFLSLYYDIPRINLRHVRVEREALRALPAHMARELGVLPIRIVEDQTGERILIIAMTDPLNEETRKTVQAHTKMQIEEFVTTYGGFMEALSRHYQTEETIEPKGYENVASRRLLNALIDALLEKGVIPHDLLKKKIEENKDV